MQTSRRDRRPNRRSKRSRRPLIVAAVAVLVVLGALGAWTVKNDGYLFGLRTPLAAADYEGTGGEPVTVEVPSGNGYTIGAELAEQDVVASAAAFVHAFNANPDAAAIQPGTREMRLQMSAASAVELLAQNEVDRSGFTVPEGYTVDQIKQSLIDQGWPQADVDAAFEDIASLLPPEADGEPEGWLFPSTYAVKPDQTPAAEVVQQMIAETTSLLDALEVPADQRETVLIKASLIEREARMAEDRPIMAAAIENRLAVDEWLGIDASLLYGLGRTSGGLTSAELADGSNPYNLSVRGNKGLPPTPIASPSRASIEAVMNPADDPEVFFWCTVNLETGETKFANTQAEHDENVAELHAWMEANPGWNG
ncbi:endolytic transglycosylase MltG [Promicromonospora umidemergens]|uniref:endolytic transglycosylase MltG n=1 Tax=Promicromonospora umidemergens TaxID=629679 RepID=UPI0020A357E8|nr:endolytic transglycosylase MltG [Promicromonospora umidemergens]